MARAPVVLMVNEHEWASRSLDTVLAPKGYAVIRAYNAAQAMDRALALRPDAVFIARSLPDMPGTQLCEQLLESDLVDAAAPIFIVAGGAVTQEERIAALRAGAWEVMTLPVDAEELLLRLGRYTRAKLESERIQDVSLTDPVTGLYSRSGVLQRATELTAAAARYGRPLACIVFEAAGDEIADSGALARELAQVLKRYTRRSDVVGRLGPSQFAIVAPDTAREGAEVVATRLRQAGLESAREGLRAGVFVFSEPGDFQLDATELLQRAASATQGPGAPGLN